MNKVIMEVSATVVAVLMLIMALAGTGDAQISYASPPPPASLCTQCSTCANPCDRPSVPPPVITTPSPPPVITTPSPPPVITTPSPPPPTPSPPPPSKDGAACPPPPNYSVGGPYANPPPPSNPSSNPNPSGNNNPRPTSQYPYYPYYTIAHSSPLSLPTGSALSLLLIASFALILVV